MTIQHAPRCSEPPNARTERGHREEWLRVCDDCGCFDVVGHRRHDHRDPAGPTTLARPWDDYGGTDPTVHTIQQTLAAAERLGVPVARHLGSGELQLYRRLDDMQPSEEGRP